MNDAVALAVPKVTPVPLGAAGSTALTLTAQSNTTVAPSIACTLPF
ncbi:MAG: hypothetical protein HC878_00195 [Leptolyngbyaceae cyanobacterium SL_5_14]|nr:hypothetical protein [Leptolyngbyaceae cyanobacterium SL_5_14]